jgi:hypothetical protein
MLPVPKVMSCDKALPKLLQLISDDLYASRVSKRWLCVWWGMASEGFQSFFFPLFVLTQKVEQKG